MTGRVFLFVLCALRVLASGPHLVLHRNAEFQSLTDSSKSKVGAPGANQNKGETAPRCKIRGTKELNVSCTYTASTETPEDLNNAARIVLKRAELTFEPNHESHMLVELEFTNEGKDYLKPTRPVYLAIDNDSGQNVIRRLLPEVDLSKIRGGERLTFSERLLVGAFVGGHYTISLWIPDPEPSRTNTPAYNLLLSSVGVPNSASGLNILGHFSIATSMHSSREK